MRRVFVGDVQGCADELEELIRRVDDAHGTDTELWFVGDLVNRGPKDLAVLELVRSRVEKGTARVVLGNHELHLLGLAWGLRDVGPTDTVDSLLARPDAGQWVDWLRKRPVVETGTLGERRFAMVHAAAAPGWSRKKLREKGAAIAGLLGHREEEVARAFLAAQASDEPLRRDLARLVTCRSVQARSWSPRLPEEVGQGAVPWHEAWSRESPNYGLVYGHWAMQGLHVAPLLRGLDTGCIHHGRGRDGFLTAWIPDRKKDDPFAVPDRSFVRVKARRRYLEG